MSFELFCRYWNPHQVGEVNCRLRTSTWTPDWLEPGWWCWLLIPSLPTNQKNVHELVTHPATLSLILSFKNLSLKAIGELGVFEHSLSPLLVQHPTINVALPSPQPGVSRLALLCTGKWTQVWFGNISIPHWCRFLLSSPRPSFICLFIFLLKIMLQWPSLHPHFKHQLESSCLSTAVYEWRERWIHTNRWSGFPWSQGVLFPLNAPC